MIRRTLATAAVVVAACAAGLTATPAARADVPLPTCTAYYEGGSGASAHWSVQSDWHVADSTTSATLDHVPGTAAGDVPCWTGDNAPSVDGTYTVAGFVGTGSLTGGDSYSLFFDDGGSLTTTANSELTDNVDVDGGTFTLGPGVTLEANGTEDQISYGNSFSDLGTLNLGANSTIIGPAETGGLLEVVRSGTVNVASSATLSGFDLDVTSGTLNLGTAAAPASLTVSGTFSEENDGAVNAFLDGTPGTAGSFSQLSAASLNLDGGHLTTATGPGFTGTNADSYQLLTSTGGITGFFADAKSYLGNGETAYPQYDADDLTEQIYQTYLAPTGNYVSGVPTGTHDDSVALRTASGTYSINGARASAHDPEASADGALLSYLEGVEADNSDARLYLANLVTGSTLTVTTSGTGGVTGAALSPDDGIIAFSQGCSIYTESTFTGSPTQLLSGDEGSCFSEPTFSSDGEQLVVTDSGSGVGSTDPDRAETGFVSTFPNSRAGDALGALSPDLSTISFVRPVSGTASLGSAVDVFVGPATFPVTGGISRRTGPDAQPAAASSSLTKLDATPLVLGGESPVRWSTDGSAVFVDGNVNTAGVGGRDGIYRFEASRQGPAELVTGTLTPASSQTGSEIAFSDFTGPTAATTLPLELKPGDPPTSFSLILDLSQYGSASPTVTYTFSGISGLSPQDVTMTDENDNTLTATSGPDGTVVVTDPLNGRDGYAADSDPFTLALAPGTPSGALQVTAEVSNEGDIATADAPIIVPSSLGTPVVSATAGDETATVNFTAATGSPTDYHVTLTPVSGGSALSDDVPPAAGPPYSTVFTGLTNGAAYVAQVTASDASEDVAPSNQVTVIPSGLPGAPSSVAATVSGQGQVTVAVGAANANGSPVTNYHVTLSGPGSPSRDLGAPGTVTFTGLPDSATYTATAFATNANGNGPPASGAAVTTSPTPAPNAPGNVTAAPGDRQATIGFTPAPGSGPASAYLVTLTPPTGAPTSVTTPGSPVVVPGLTNGTVYAVTVLAIGPGGRSPVSGQRVTVTPAGRPTPPHITGIAPAPETLEVGFTQANGDGAPILSDTVTCVGTNHQTATAKGLGSPILVTHLHNQVNYTCGVVATTAVGTSLVSNKVIAHPGKLPNVKLTLPKTAAKGTMITISATLTSAGDLVPHRLSTLYVSADTARRRFRPVATGFTNSRGVVVFHVKITKNTIYQVQAYFGPALARNLGDRVRIS